MISRTPQRYRPYPPVTSMRPTRSRAGRQLVNFFADTGGAVAFVTVLVPILFVLMMLIRVFLAWQSGRFE